MKKIAIFILTSIFAILISSYTCYGEELAQAPEMTSQGCLLMDLDSGQILYSKNMHQKLYPASTTKILTALIVLEKCSLTDIVTVGEKPPYADGTKIYLIKDEQLTVEQLLYAMMLESANDCAMALAEYISGNEEAFAQLMNQKARELGCTDSNFVNPHGLHDKNHYTSAYDLALITREAMKNPVFCRIVATRSSQIQPTNQQPELRYLNNLNKLFFYGQYYYDGADGVKTGYTSEAKNTLVASCMRDGLHLLGVFLDCSSWVYKDATALLDYGYSSYSNKALLDSENPVSTVFFDGSNESVDLYPSESLSVAVPIDTEPEVTEKIVLTSDFSQIRSGDQVGYMEVSIENGDTYKMALVTHSDYENTTYTNGRYKGRSINTTFLRWLVPLIILTELCVMSVIYKKRRFS